MKGQWLLVLGVLLAGCAPIDSGEVNTPVNKSLSTQVPEYTGPSQFKLPNGRRFVSLGETEDKALAVFPRPSRGFLLEEPIPGFPDDFKAKGWESNTEGFGIILHEDKIVLAMRQYEGIEADEFAALLESVKVANGIDHFEGVTHGKAEYWYKYSTSGQDKLVISRLPGAKKRYQVSVTLGNKEVVEALGILKSNSVETATTNANNAP